MEVNTIQMTQEPPQDPSANPESQEETFVMPEKFIGKSAEEIAKAYTHLEKVKGRDSTNNEDTEGSPTSDKPQVIVPDPSKETEGKPQDKDTPEDNANSEVPDEIAPADFSKYTEELNTEGTLSEDSYKELVDKYNLPQEMVDNYIEGQKAKEKLHWDSVASQVGGMDKLKEMVTWANQHYQPSELTGLSTALNGDEFARNLALQDLNTKFTQASSEPNFVSGNAAGGAPPVKGFSSKQEMARAMSDPKYKTDPGYQAEVQQRLKYSGNLF